MLNQVKRRRTLVGAGAGAGARVDRGKGDAHALRHVPSIAVLLGDEAAPVHRGAEDPTADRGGTMNLAVVPPTGTIPEVHRIVAV